MRLGKRSNHLNVVGQNWSCSGLHDGVLRKLFGVIGARPALKNDAVAANDDAEVADSTAESALHERFQVLFLEDGVVDC